MRNLVACTLLLICLAVPFAGQPDSWHRYKNTDGNFSALVPVEPQDSVNAASEDQNSHTLLAMSDGNGYLVVFVNTKSEQPVDEATYKIYRDSFTKSLPNCDLVTEAPASPAIPGYIGHWYRMNCDAQGKKISFVGNLYWGRHYAYGVMTMFPTAPDAPATAKKFSDSFSLIDSGK